MPEHEKTKGGVLTSEPLKIIELFPMRRQHLDYSVGIALSPESVITLRRIGLVRSIDVEPKLQARILVTDPLLIPERTLLRVDTGAKHLDQANSHYQYAHKYSHDVLTPNIASLTNATPSWPVLATYLVRRLTTRAASCWYLTADARRSRGVGGGALPFASIARRGERTSPAATGGGEVPAAGQASDVHWLAAPDHRGADEVDDRVA